MSKKSTIEWTGGTWNPVAGCEKCSSGCANCYANKDAIRMGSNPNPKISRVYGGLAYRQKNGVLNWTGVVRCVPERLAVPFTWGENKRVFVNSQSDLFHADVPFDFIRRVFDVMEAADWLTFQCLTKRAERLEELAGKLPWPKNVWMGVSVENQDAAWRVPHLQRTPARVRFLSVEPMIGPVTVDLSGIHLVITGGESGPRARPFDPAWAVSMRAECRAAGACFFHKQNGGRNKKKAGRLLGGVLYEELPESSTVSVPPAAERRRRAARFKTPDGNGGRTPLVVL